jgi:hypothetical protein
VVVFNDRVFFPGLLWNSSFSNRLVWIPETPDYNYLQKANELGAVWAFCRQGDPACNPFRQPGSGWHEIPGGYHVEPGWGSVMERDQP